MLEKLIGLGIVQWKTIWVQFYPVALLDQSTSFFNDGQRSKSQEIHLEQTGVFYHRVVKLGTPHLAVLGARHRYELADIAWRDNYPTGMNTCIAQRPL